MTKLLEMAKAFEANAKRSRPAVTKRHLPFQPQLRGSFTVKTAPFKVPIANANVPLGRTRQLRPSKASA